MRAVDLNDKQPDMIAAYGVASPDADPSPRFLLVHDGVAMIESRPAPPAAGGLDPPAPTSRHAPRGAARRRAVVRDVAVGAPFFRALRATSQSDVGGALVP